MDTSVHEHRPSAADGAPSAVDAAEIARRTAGFVREHVLPVEREMIVAGRPMEEVGGGVTVSIGVASCPENARTERELFGTSDAALYRAKQEGRNRAVLATATGPTVASRN